MWETAIAVVCIEFNWLFDRVAINRYKNQSDLSHAAGPGGFLFWYT